MRKIGLFAAILSLGACSVLSDPPGPDGATVPTPPPPRPAAKPAPVPPPPDLNQLKGSSPEAVRAVLGAPKSTDRKSNMLAWTYRAAPCSLTLYFFPDMSDGAYGLLDYDITGERDDGACLSRIRRGR